MVQEIRREFDYAIEDIVTRGRKNNTARDIATCLARNVCGTKGCELGEYFGNVSGASITMTHKRATEFLKNDKRYKDLVNRVRKRIFKI
jgi:chromosomal replication initiation ATPase DnaA